MSGASELVYASLREANVARQAEWCPEQVPDLSFRGNELAGETGEVCNVIKKLERERLGWRGSRDTVEHLSEELADVVICADLVAISAGIDLNAAVAAKFNATSEKVGLPHRLEAALAASRAELVALREALAPFAAFAEALAEHVPDNIAIGIYADGGMRFGPSGGCSVGDLRRARAALAGEKPVGAGVETKTLRTALLAVVAATRAYLPPDGIDAQECLNRILAATDNPTINPYILEAEHGRS